MLIDRIVDALNAEGVKFAVVGGHAVALHGAIRGTVDLDLVLAATRENFVAAERALKSLGLVSRIPASAEEVFAFRREYMEKRNLLAWGFIHPKDPSQIVDVVLTWELKPGESVKIRSMGREIPVLGKPALIAMKRASGRPQDLIDAEALEKQ